MVGFNVASGWGPDDRRAKNDFYPTPPAVTRTLLAKEEFFGPILEPCAGAGHVVRELERAGYDVTSNEPYPQGGFLANDHVSFFSSTNWSDCRSIVTNPPFRLAEEFIRRTIAMSWIEKHAWLLRLQFVESARRYPLFRDYPPVRVWVFSKRVQVSARGLVNPVGGMIPYAWWIWERGHGDRPTELRWFPPDAVK